MLIRFADAALANWPPLLISIARRLINTQLLINKIRERRQICNRRLVWLVVQVVLFIVGLVIVCVCVVASNLELVLLLLFEAVILSLQFNKLNAND